MKLKNEKIVQRAMAEKIGNFMGENFPEDSESLEFQLEKHPGAVMSDLKILKSLIEALEELKPGFLEDNQNAK